MSAPDPLPKRQPIWMLAEMGLPDGMHCRVVGRSWKPGRTVYGYVGRMHRDRSDRFCFVAKTWDQPERILPDDTVIELVPIGAP